MPKRVIVLGSTGSIGRSALEVAAALRDEVTIVGLAARREWRRLAEQAARFEAPIVAIADETFYDDLRRSCPASTRVLAGAAGLLELIETCAADFVLAAIVGSAGLPATLAGVARGLDVGLANKESLVMAGALLMPLARERGGALIPVDSEHSAIFQALHAGQRADVRRVCLTASGGPFRQWPAERIARATLADALNHPTWSMGPKITIDSATMMNKALEIIEAHWLFSLAPEQIEVLIHPESVVHSMVEFQDGFDPAEPEGERLPQLLQGRLHRVLPPAQDRSGLHPGRVDIGEVQGVGELSLARFPAMRHEVDRGEARDRDVPPVGPQRDVVLQQRPGLVPP